MARIPDPDTVFTKPDAPCSDWELFKWMFFEPTLLKQYGRTLGRRESVLPVIRVYCKYIVPLVLPAYVLLVTFLGGD